MNNRLKIYSDAECKLPIEVFDVAGLKKGENRKVNFYLRNEGFVAIEDVKVNVMSTHKDVSARILSEDSFKRFGSGTVYKGEVEISSAGAVEGKIDIDVKGVICTI